MQPPLLFQQLVISVGLGLLVGLQRQSVASRLGGVRTFPMVTILGSVSAMLAQSFGGWIIAAGLIALAALLFSGNQAEVLQGHPDPGLTTEIAILLMYLVGAYLMIGSREAAVAIGGGIAVLLHFKGELHSAVASLSDKELKAIMQFALISLVIFPVLPDRTYGPYQVLNPRNIWLMVILIVGINLSGYIIYKFFGERAGILLGGILGGLISSTATTVSFARRAASAPDTSRPAAVAILIASAVVFARMLLEIVAVAPSFLPYAAARLLVMLVVISGGAYFMWMWEGKEREEMPPQDNPTELKSALFFGLIYGVVLLATSFAQDRFGNNGLYFVAGISGLTDVDAITLSTSQMVNHNRLDPNDGWRVIVIAALSNLVFKVATIAVLGSRRLFKLAGCCLGLAILAGIGLLFT